MLFVVVSQAGEPKAMRQIVAHKDKTPKRSKRKFQKVILFRYPYIRFSSSPAGANRWDWCRRKLWDCRTYIHQFDYFSFSLHLLHIALYELDFIFAKAVFAIDLSINIGDGLTPVDVGIACKVL